MNNIYLVNVLLPILAFIFNYMAHLTILQAAQHFFIL
jgi:hypothetical protein